MQRKTELVKTIENNFKKFTWQIVSRGNVSVCYVFGKKRSIEKIAVEFVLAFRQNS